MHDCSEATRKEFLSTEEKPFHYAESGLPNIFLVGVRYFECQCGEKFVEIPAIKQLHSLIARNVVLKNEALSGEEIRFLRKRLGQKASDFAVKIYLQPETLSRVENNKQKVSLQTDSYIRVYYAFSSKDNVLIDAMKEAVDTVLNEQREAPPKKPPKTVATIKKDEWALSAVIGK